MSRATQQRALKATTVLAAVVTAVAVSAPPAMATSPVNLGGTTRALSVDAAGTTIDGRAPSVSRDGRYTAFARSGPGGWGIVLHDAVTGSETAVPRVPGYELMGNLAVSADGRFVVYGGYSAADPLRFRIFRHNVATNSGTVMPAPSTGGEPYGLTQFSVSANGRFIAFLGSWRDASLATRSDVFVTDATARTTTPLGVELPYTDADHQLMQPAISGDGTKVAFATSASLVTRDTNTHFDIYVHDRATGAEALASRTVAGGTGNKQSTQPWISGDGRFVAFNSRSTNLAPGVTDTSITQAYVVDTSTFRTTMMSKTAAGVAGDAFAHVLGISSTGRFVVFESPATNYGFPANPFGLTGWQIYRYDRVNDTIGLVSHAAGKKYPSDRGSGALDAVISADGAHIAYSSTSRDLDRTAVDEYNSLDLFAWAQ